MSKGDVPLGDIRKSSDLLPSHKGVCNLDKDERAAADKRLATFGEQADYDPNDQSLHTIARRS